MVSSKLKVNAVVPDLEPGVGLMIQQVRGEGRESKKANETSNGVLSYY